MSTLTDQQLQQINARLARIQQRGARLDELLRQLTTRPQTPEAADAQLVAEAGRPGGERFAIGPARGPTAIFDGPALKSFLRCFPRGDPCREQYLGGGGPVHIAPLEPSEATGTGYAPRRLAGYMHKMLSPVG
jgi:hypothetical protein